MSLKKRSLLTDPPEGVLRKKKKIEVMLGTEGEDLTMWKQFVQEKKEYLLQKKEAATLNAEEQDLLYVLEAWTQEQEGMQMKEPEGLLREKTKIEVMLGMQGEDMTTWNQFLCQKMESLQKKKETAMLDVKEQESLHMLEVWTHKQEGLQVKELINKKRCRTPEDESRNMRQKVNPCEHNENVYVTATASLALTEKAPLDLCNSQERLNWFSVATCRYTWRRFRNEEVYVRSFEHKTAAHLYYKKLQILQHRNLLNPLAYFEQNNGVKAVVVFPEVTCSLLSFLRTYRRDLWLERTPKMEGCFTNKLIRLYRSAVRAMAHVHSRGFYVGRLKLENIFLRTSGQHCYSAVLKLVLPALEEQCRIGVFLSGDELKEQQDLDYKHFQCVLRESVLILDPSYFDSIFSELNCINQLIHQDLGSQPIRKFLESSGLVTFEQRFYLFAVLDKVRFREKFHNDLGWDLVRGWIWHFADVLVSLKPEHNLYTGWKRFASPEDDDRPINSKYDMNVFIRSLLFHFYDQSRDTKLQLGRRPVNALRQFERVYPTFMQEIIDFLSARYDLGDLLFLA